MTPSSYVNIVLTVPVSHADTVRKAMGNAGAGKTGNYSHCSFSSKGIGRFIPNENAQPHIGQKNVLEEVEEERIETVCSLDSLTHVVEEIKKAHAYEETVIYIYPVFELGIKKRETL